MTVAVHLYLPANIILFISLSEQFIIQLELLIKFAVYNPKEINNWQENAHICLLILIVDKPTPNLLSVRLNSLYSAKKACEYLFKASQEFARSIHIVPTYLFTCTQSHAHCVWCCLVLYIFFRWEYRSIPRPYILHISKRYCIETENVIHELLCSFLLNYSICMRRNRCTLKRIYKVQTVT